jgi:outer membrane translocation and assembly module TamA
MRGFFEGRFRDKHYLAAQAEWRQPVYKRIHASAFIAAGEVASSLSSFSNRRIKVAGGGGIRLLLNPKESVFVRFDYAWNNEGSGGFYIRIYDAF